MDKLAKRELAQAIVETHRIREKSYAAGHGGRVGRYTKSYQKAADEAVTDQDVRALVVTLLLSGFSDVHDWADTVLSKEVL